MKRAAKLPALLAALTLLPAQQAPEAPQLTAGHVLKLELGGGEKRVVRIAADAGDYLRIEVQAGRDLAVKTSLFDPAGSLAAVTPSLGGTGGVARIAAYAEKAGAFRLEIVSPMFRPDPLPCSVTLTVKRAATTEDRLDAEAHRSFAAAAAAANSGADGMRRAITALDRPIELARQANDPVLEMRATFGQGQFLGTLGEQSGAMDQFQKSLPALQRCLDLCRRFGDPRAESHVLSSLGQSYSNLERYREAVDWYGQALELQRSTGQAWETALTLDNLAHAEAVLGRLDLSLDYLREQEVIRQELKDELGLNQMRVSLGETYLALGDFEHALEALAATLPRWAALNDPQSEVDAYAKLGLAYMAAGDYDVASQTLEKAVALSRKLHNSKIASGNLILLGQLAGLRHDSEGASAIYERALTEARDGGYRRDEALALVGLAGLDIAGGRPRAALPRLGDALRIALDTAAPYDEANIRRALGEARVASGENRRALDEFEAALAIERRLGDRFGEVQTLADLAALDEKDARDQRALVRLGEAMDVIDNTRSSLAEPGLRASYLASQRSIYEQAAGLLTRMSAHDSTAGYERRAFEVSERAHARALLDVIRKTADEFEPRSDAALGAEARALDSALHAAAVQHESRRTGELLAERNQIELRLREKIAAGAAPESAAPLALPAIRDKLVAGGDTVLLEYLTGRAESHLWVLTGSDLRHYTLPGEARLETAARELYDALTERNRAAAAGEDPAVRSAAADRKAAELATSLSRVLLPMPASTLASHPLIFVVDGALQLVPFSLLSAPGEPGKTLGESNPLVMAPSASVLAHIREAGRPAAAPRLLVLADPVYSAHDPRVDSGRKAPQAAARDTDVPLLRSAAEDFSRQDFERLRMSHAEAEAIEKLAPAGRVTALLGFDAAPAAFRRADIARYSIIHVAAHTLLDNRHPELSGLVLSLVDRQGRRRDGFLRLFDIYEMRLHAGLVVLSACETSIGKEMRGEGMLGLSRGFLTAGSQRVLSSLWKVDDRATAEFMRHFYTALLKRHCSAAAALAAAQRAMREDPAWKSPYYWAPFVLQGDF